MTYAGTPGYTAPFIGGSVTWAPTSGSGHFAVLRLNATINQTGSATGNYTGLLVNVVEAATTGNNKFLMDLQTGGSSRFAVTSAGAVGIGTANPGAKLHVNGSFTASGDVTIGGLNSRVIASIAGSYVLPALGTRLSFLNVANSSVCKIHLASSENGFHQPVELYVSRDGDGTVPSLVRSSRTIHHHSNSIGFSSDANGDVWLEKTAFNTGRTISLFRVDQLRGTCTVLNGSSTDVAVGADQSTSFNFWSQNGTSVYYNTGNVGTRSSFLRT